MWLGHHFQGQKVKGQGHQAALLSTVLTRKAAAAVSVGTYSAWESTVTLRLLGGVRRGGEGRGHFVSPRAQLVETAWLKAIDLGVITIDLQWPSEIVAERLWPAILFYYIGS